MCTPSHRPNHKQGYILGTTLVIMLLFMVTCATFLDYTYVDSRETQQKENNIQVFWASESANNLAIRTLELSPGYRTNPTNLTGQMGDIDFSTEITRDHHFYTLKTTSSFNDWQRTLENDIETTPVDWHPAYNTYAAFLNSGTISTTATTTVTGPTYDDSSSGSETLPLLDSGYYDDLLSKAASSGDAPLPTTIALYDEDVYILGNQSIASITGPGSLIVSGDILVLANATVGPNVTLIAGDKLTMQNDIVTATNTSFYATGILSVQSQCTFAAASTLLSSQSITMSNDCSIDGALYAAQSISINSNLTLNGSAVAGTALSFDANSSISHAPQYFAPVVPPVLQGSDEHVIQRNAWAEKTITANPPP